MPRSSLLLAVSAFLLTAPVETGAEEARPVAEGAATGYELSLQGVVTSELGTSVRLHGIAYEVDGLATLRPRSGLVVDAEVTAQRSQGRGREVVSRASTTAEGSGRFVLDVPVPERALPSPLLELTVHRREQPGRTFTYSLSTRQPHHLDLLLDRRRYQPEETVHSWVRITEERGHAPVKGATVRLTVIDGAGRPAAEQRSTSSAAGVTSFEVELPASASEGRWQVRAEVVDGGLASPAEQTFLLTRRTVERLQATVELDQELVWPDGALTGHVVVRTPSGSAVRGAQIELVSGSAEPLRLATDAEGIARFETQAPAFLSGDVSTQSLEARVVHAAHGTIRATATYLLTRVNWMVEATPSAGGLVPEVESELFLGVNDPRGRPIGAGTKVRVRGEGIADGEVEVETDAHGLVTVTTELPRGAAARRRSGECAGVAATSLEVEVMSDPPVLARLCVPVAVEALVLPRSDRPVAEPGSDLTVSVQRRPEVRGRPVLIEALWDNRAVGWTWLGGRETQGTLELPEHLQGVIELRARPLFAPDRTRPLDEPGATAMGVGASTAVLVRPADAFTLEVEPTQELWRIRQQAQVQLRTSQPPAQGWAALLVRDQAAHGGEGRWDLEWIRGELQEALDASDEPAGDRFLRSALASHLTPDREQSEPPPLINPPWLSSRTGGSYRPWQAKQLGVLRDPVALREELLRRGLAPATRALEQAVSGLGSDERAREGIVRQRGKRVEFHPEVIANLIEARRLNAAQARTLGGEPLTLAMIRGADSSVSFDTVARRVARARLVRLLRTLVTFADPDNEAAARASAGEPPERWLSRLVQLSMVEAEALVDPWGRPFVFRRATGRRPRLIVSERAVDFELLSPGPDGVAGTGDDVRDPFERAVTRGTPYAISSGEDALMEQLALIAPGRRVLQAMVRAYDRMSLAAREEGRRGPVDATTSEDMNVPLDTLVEGDSAGDSMGFGGLGLQGVGQGGGGTAAPASAPSRARRRASRSSAGEGADDGLLADAEMAAEEPLAQPMAPPPASGTRAGAAGAMVREEFPATLFFTPEIPIDSQGQAEVTLPLADALTTYRLEAIAWTASGWTTSAMGRLRVDQEAMVDAPVPPFATVGDHLRLPVRVANRTDQALTARLGVEAEGELSLEDPEAVTVEVPAGEAVEAIVDLRLGQAGSGSLLIRALRASDGAALDAVRRPLEVLPDVRLAREVREVLLEGGEPLRVVVPAEARERGPGELRLAVGRELFGDPAVWGAEHGLGGALWGGWALVASDQPVPEELRSRLLQMIPEVEHETWHRTQPQIALALAVLWGDDRLSDEMVRAGLRQMHIALPVEGELLPEPPPSGGEEMTLLLALAPVLTDLDRRPELREDLEEIGEQLRRAVSSSAARATEAPVIWARAAAALALAQSGDQGRAQEMLRRANRNVIEVGDQAWLEPETTDGTVLRRLEPTALLALATLELGQDREVALTLLRSLIRSPSIMTQWPVQGRALASVAAARLTGATFDPEQVTVELDGRPVEVQREEGVLTAVLDGIGQPGEHVISVQTGPGQLVLAWLDLRYGLPWSVRPRREAQIELDWSGEVGARDGRSGLRLEVVNRGARILNRPIVEIELPAGVELDEPTREALSEQLARPPSVEGRTLRLALRPLAPGGYLRLPLPLRWSVSGTLIGLGTTIWDEVGPTPLAARPTQVLPSRGVEVADRGEEPEPAEHEASPPPIQPRPQPLPPLEPLAAEVF